MFASKLVNSVFLTVGLLVTTTDRSSAQEPGNERPATTEEQQAFGGAWSYPNYRSYDRPLVEARSYHDDLSRLPEPNRLSRDAATIVVHVPENAKVWFNGQLMSATGTRRVFETPTLIEPDRYVYSYEVRFGWDENGKPVSRAQTLNVTPGKKFSVWSNSKGKSEPSDRVTAKRAERIEDRSLPAKPK